MSYHVTSCPTSPCRNVCSKFFGPVTGFVNMITQHIPSPIDNGPAKVLLRHLYQASSASTNPFVCKAFVLFLTPPPRSTISTLVTESQS